MLRAPLFIVVILLGCTGIDVQAQEIRPQFGFGFTTTVTTDSDDPVGIGLQFRGSMPVNPDLSFSVGTGVTGFVFGGRDEAVYFATPQVSAILTLNATLPQSPYVIFGLGGYLPFGGDTDERSGGPTLHGGIGWVILLQQSSVFIEINPALAIAKSSAEVILPLKIGVVL